MRNVLSCCATLLLTVVLVPGTQAQTSAGQTTSSAATAAEVQQLRDALAAQQKQIAEQQAKIEALAKLVESQQRHAPALGEVASTTPVLPSGNSSSAETSLSASLGQGEQKRPEAPPPASDSIVLKNGKIRIGAVAFADWAIYPKTGFGPAFLDLPNMYPGPGNDNYNAFDVTRTYINFLFSPTDWVTFRITPDIYRNIGKPAADKLGNASAIGSTPDGSLDIRLKYAYAEFTKLFSGALKDDDFRAGQQTNPLIDWQEGLYGYRFVSLVPWNFISLSSTYTGVSLNGPIKWSGKQYLDYQIGAFNNSNFHGFDLAETKTAMARLSVYPFGASSKYEGLGLTGFVDYGYNNVAPDNNNQTPVVRVSALAHYQSKHNGGQIAFEYMFGRNAFSTGNLFGGSAPLDIAGLSTTPTTAGTLAKTVLAGRSVKQQGYDVFGHINFGKTNWALFGLYQFFQPNKDFANDPLDFDRVVAGISYRVNKNVRVAFDSQDVLYRRHGVSDTVLPDVKALFLNMEFAF